MFLLILGPSPCLLRAVPANAAAFAAYETPRARPWGSALRPKECVPLSLRFNGHYKSTHVLISAVFFAPQIFLHDCGCQPLSKGEPTFSPSGSLRIEISHKATVSNLGIFTFDFVRTPFRSAWNAPTPTLIEATLAPRKSLC